MKGGEREKAGEVRSVRSSWREPGAGSRLSFDSDLAEPDVPRGPGTKEGSKNSILRVLS